MQRIVFLDHIFTGMVLAPRMEQAGGARFVPRWPSWVAYPLRFPKGGPLFARATFARLFPVFLSISSGHNAATRPKRLPRVVGHGDVHFVTFCCCHRRALLGTIRARNFAVAVLREIRQRYRFALIGYVLMPEHVHLIIGEDGEAPPSRIVQSFTQRVSRRWRGKKRGLQAQLPLPFPEAASRLRRFWQRRDYDFNIYTAAKLPEKIHNMHSNPVRAKLVSHPGDWPWSSWCDYYRGEGLLQMDACGQSRLA